MLLPPLLLAAASACLPRTCVPHRQPAGGAMWRSCAAAARGAAPQHHAAGVLAPRAPAPCPPRRPTAAPGQARHKSKKPVLERTYVNPLPSGRQLYHEVQRMRPLLPADRLTPGQISAIDTALATAGGIFVGGPVATGKTETLLHIHQQLVAEGTGFTGHGAVNGVYLGTTGVVRNPALGPDSCFRKAFSLPTLSYHSEYLTASDPHDLAERMSRGHGAQLAQQIHTLVLDDIEQLDYDQWTTIGRAFALIRKSTLPWGGVRVIGAADFPAAEQGTSEYATENHAFEAKNWAEVFRTHIELEGADGRGRSFVHDAEFSALLLRLRSGHPTGDDIAALAAREIAEEDYDDHGLGFAFAKAGTLTEYDAVTDGGDAYTAYEDPLVGRTLVFPCVAEMKTVSMQFDDTVRQLRGKMKFRACQHKARFLPPEECRHYDIFVDHPAGPVYGALPSDVQRLLLYLQDQGIFEAVRSMGYARPQTVSGGFLAGPIKQAFARGEEVELSMDNADMGLHKGMRGTVTALHDTYVSVLFHGWATAVDVPHARFDQRIIVSETTISKLENFDLTLLPPDRTVTTSVYFIPLSPTKAAASEHLYASPFVNGQIQGDAAPEVVIDLATFEEAGSFRSLYATLAHAPSLAKVRFLGGSLNPDDFTLSDVVYPPAPLFHRTADPSYDLSDDLCPVCSRALGDTCPMHPEDDVVGVLSPRDKLAYCTVTFSTCPVDGTTMKRQDFLDHQRRTQVVMCECGAKVRLRDLQEHRSMYVVDTKCLGPKKGKKQTAQEAMQDMMLEEDQDGRTLLDDAAMEEAPEGEAQADDEDDDDDDEPLPVKGKKSKGGRKPKLSSA